MPKLQDETIRCPECGKLQSKRNYIEECCWNCGSIRKLQEVIREATYRRPFGDVDRQTIPEADREMVEETDIDESQIKKMSEL